MRFRKEKRKTQPKIEYLIFLAFTLAKDINYHQSKVVKSQKYQNSLCNEWSLNSTYALLLQ